MKHSGPAPIFRFLVSAVLTGLAIVACWWLWSEVPKYNRMVMLQDFRFLVSILVIYLVLSLVNPLIDRLWAMISGEQGEQR